MSYKKKIILWTLWIIGIIIISIIIINLYVLSFSKDKIEYFTSNIDGYNIGLVLWASVYNKKSPSPVLEERLNMARILYGEWKIKKIIVSGDNSSMDYNEPIAMKNYLLEQWVEEDDIYLDYAWFDTYNSIYRAKSIFWVQKMVIFTQEYHLKRAIYIAQWLWIDGIGLEDDVFIIDYFYELRELISRVKAFFNVEVFKSKPKYGWEQIKIIFDEDLDEAKKRLLEEE